MRNLVTGGAGFVGSHLVDQLMDAGEEVICLDNYFTGRKSNVVKWLGHPRFELIRHDVTDPIRVEVDRIWHLACPASPVHYQHNPIKTAKTSFLYKFVVVDIFAMKRSSFQETLLTKSILQTKTGGDSRKTIIINPNALLCLHNRFNHHSSTNSHNYQSNLNSNFKEN